MFFQALLFTAFLELGGMYGGMYNYTVPEMNTIIPLYSKMSAQVEYEGLYVGGEMDCYFLAEKVTNYEPFQMTYIFKAGYKFDKIEIGYEHSCFHPFKTYAMVIENEIKPKYEGMYDKVFVRISTR